MAFAPQPERCGEIGEGAQLGYAVSRRIHPNDVEGSGGSRPAVVSRREPHRVGSRDGGLEPAPQLPPAFQVLVRERVLEPAEAELVQHEAERPGRVPVVQAHRVHHEVDAVAGRLSGGPACRDVDVEIAADVKLDGPESRSQQLFHHRLGVSRAFDRRGARTAAEAPAAPSEHVGHGKALSASREIPERHVHDADDRERKTDTKGAPEWREDAGSIERIGPDEVRNGSVLDCGDHGAYRQLGGPGKCVSLLVVVSLQGHEYGLHVHRPAPRPPEVAADVVGFNRDVGNVHGGSSLGYRVRVLRDLAYGNGGSASSRPTRRTPLR